MSFKKTLLLEFTDFQDFPGPPTIFKNFQVLENAKLKLKNFPGFSGPVRTLKKLRVTKANYLSKLIHQNSHAMAPYHMLQLNTLERTLMLRLILMVKGSLYSEINKSVTDEKLKATCG